MAKDKKEGERTGRLEKKNIFDNQIIVIVQISGLTFSLYSYEEPDPSAPAQPNPVGGYLPLLKLTDPIYLKALSALTKKYTFFLVLETLFML